MRVVEIPRQHNPFDPFDRSSTELPPTLVDMLRAHVLATPDAEAVVEVDGARLTYAGLWERASRVAGGLRAAGIGSGARVAVRYPAGVNWVLAFWGTLLAGAIAVVVNTRSAVPEVNFVLEDSGAALDLAPGSALPDGEPFVAAEITAADVAAFFYTSGTTGRPKGVPTTHRAFIANAENMIRCSGIERDAGAGLRTLISVPLFHVTGCNSQMLVAAYVGGTSVIMPTLNLPALLEVVVEEKISFIVTVPAVYALLLRHPRFGDADLSGVRTVGYGGAPITPQLVGELAAAFPRARLMNGYGMTETASLITVLPHRDAVEHADSVGYAVPSVEIGVIPAGEYPNEGELVVRGANVAESYWHRPQATADTMISGWLRTGDVVRVDEAGRVFIVDRMKDIINRGGENVSSIEVETVLLSAPGVVEAAVLAVPDDVMGEKVGAVLVTESAPFDLATVLEHCREHLADFKIPQYAVLLDGALPRNPGGKVLKGQLRAEIQWGKPLR